MEYKLNPWPIFEEIYFQKMTTNNVNKHYLSKDKKSVIFKANVNNLPYYDHIETSNFYSSLIFSYGADKTANFISSYHLVFPTFRRKENDTRGSFAIRIKEPLDIYVNNLKVKEKLTKVVLDGLIKIDTTFKNIKIDKKIVMPKYPGATILYTLKNNATRKKEIVVNIPTNYISCDPNDYFEKPYHIEIALLKDNQKKSITTLKKTLKPKETMIFYLTIRCLYDHSQIKNYPMLTSNALLDRSLYLYEMDNYCHLITNNPILDTMFYFAKIRCSESIFKTKNGLMHAPGGGQYYAANWTNDQCEYAAPFFAYFPYIIAKESMINCFRLYEKYMYSDQDLVSSIIAEATDFWNGAGDRGDASMYVYGLTNFLLASGNKKLAKEFIKPITWCLEHTLKKTSKEGLIISDSDELENRFESGSINLATNAITYDALVKTSLLFKELKIKNDYDIKTIKLKENINKYFYHNHQCLYCKEETHLRAHVVYPLIMDIFEHQEDIIKTITSNSIYTENGFKVIDNEEVYWDRITLMAIRGLFKANKADLAYQILLKYSEKRLLNDHVPYAIEAYPEGNQAHLAAESALYARIYLEGILGYEPLGFNSFKLHLSIPKEIKTLSYENFNFANRLLSIYVIKEKDGYYLKIPEIGFARAFKNYEDIIVEIPKKKMN